MYFNNNVETNIDKNFTKKSKININPKMILFITIPILIIIIIIFTISPSKNETYLVLEGSTDIIIFQNDKYIEPGYRAYDSKGNDYTNEVTIEGIVNPEIVGEYQISYKYQDIVKYRTITVINSTNQKTYLILSGENPIYLKKGEAYQEPGYAVIDTHQNDLQSQVKITSNVDNNKSGTYKIIYSVTNNSGVTVTEERTIIVTDSDITLSYDKTTMTKEAINISYYVNDNYLDYILLPDGTKSTSRNGTYKVSENGTYKFVVYSKNGSKKEKEIIIKNIDLSPPKINCEVVIYDKETKIIANAQDDNSIKGYIYQYGNNKTSLIKSNTYTFSTNESNVSVTVYDNANNQNKATCKVTYKITRYERSYKEYTSSDYNYMLYIPQKLSTRNKLPLVVFLHGAGECGSELSKVNSHGFPKYIKDGENFDFVLLAPQVPFRDCSKGWNPEKVMNLTKKIMNEYPVDHKRIVITGFSLGGVGTYRMVDKYPDFFSVAIPVAGVYAYNDNLTKTPIIAYKGALDPNVSNSDHDYLKKMITAVNPKSSFITYKGYGHPVASLAYREEKVLKAIQEMTR